MMAERTQCRFSVMCPGSHGSPLRCRLLELHSPDGPTYTPPPFTPPNTHSAPSTQHTLTSLHPTHTQLPPLNTHSPPSTQHTLTPPHPTHTQLPPPHPPPSDLRFCDSVTTGLRLMLAPAPGSPQTSEGRTLLHLLHLLHLLSARC